jgi:heterodisulfide reductase subunit A
MLLKEKIPDVEITVLYVDVRAFGKGFEEFYDRVRESGVRYVRGNASEIYRQGEGVAVLVEDTLEDRVTEIPADLVVLATGLTARGDAQRVANLLRIPRGPDGFFMEAHPKLRPVDTVNDGVFIAGCCQGPKDIPDAVAQAKGAASAVMAVLSHDRIRTEPVTADIDEDVCSGCRLCEGVCPYGALHFDPEKKRMTVNSILCKGCGACGATCPSNAISSRHFTNEQILAQLEALT